MKMKKRVALLATSVLIAALILVGILYAAEIAVDTFDDVQGSQYPDLAPSPNEVVMRDPPDTLSGFILRSDSEVVTGTGVLGLERDLMITATSGTYANLTLDEGTPGDNELSFFMDTDCEGKASIQWDGEDGDPGTLDRDGLPAGHRDLTGGGTNDGFLIAVTYSDRRTDLSLEVYSNTSVATYTVRVPGNLDDSPSRMDIFMPFDDFNGDSSVFSSAGAVMLQIDGTVDSGLDFSADFFKVTSVREYGDLPTSTYGARTLDAYHIPGGLRLGNNVDAEAAPNDSSDTTGDDTDDFDDEDGITPTNNWSGGTGTIVAHVEGCPSAGCYINGWIDWNGNGYFTDTVDGASEHIFSETETSDCTPNYTFDVPSTFGNGCYYARFRICDGASTNCDDPGVDDTAVSNGEIEDYYWCWGPTAITLTDMTAHSNTLTIALGAVALAAVGLMGAVVILRRRRA
jgi:hypothetical protein